jgi:DNA-binding beta-propeller fold protein YncE
MSPRNPLHDRTSTRRDFLRLTAHGLVASGCLAFPETSIAVPALDRPKGGVAVLDDCDPDYQGKDTYEDNLSIFDGSAKLVARITGLNVCEEIGSPHRVTVDASARRIWVAESVGHRLLQYDMAGKEVLSLPNVKASAIAVDPSTHHLWVATSTGRIGQGSIEVYDPRGKQVATNDAYGFDLAYDPKGKAFWSAGTDLVKLSPAGNVLIQKNITGWCSSSLAVDAKSGMVWVLTRKHPQAGGKDALLAFDTDGRERHAIELDQGPPFRVAVDPTDGVVWVTIWNKSLLIFTADGKLKDKHEFQALAVDVEVGTGNAWVATAEEVLKINRDGKVLSRAEHKARTTQAWIASF